METFCAVTVANGLINEPNDDIDATDTGFGFIFDFGVDFGVDFGFDFGVDFGVDFGFDSVVFVDDIFADDIFVDYLLDDDFPSLLSLISCLA